MNTIDVNHYATCASFVFVVITITVISFCVAFSIAAAIQLAGRI